MSEQASRRQFLAVSAGAALAGGCGGAMPPTTNDPIADPMTYPASTRPAVPPMDTSMPMCPATAGLIAGPLASSLNVNTTNDLATMPIIIGGIVHAIVRDSQAVYALRLKCPHAGCQPALELATQTWLCPCHGSRFNIDGSLINGPAPTPLPRFFVCEGADGKLYIDPTKMI